MNNYIDKYIKQGIRIFSCYSNKTPVPKNGFYGATLEPEEIQKQFYDDSFLIGLPTGNTNGIVVIDIDVKDGRTVEELLEELKQYVQLPENLFQVQTPSGGMHLYFSVINTNLSSSVRFFDKNLATDLRANGGYVCAPDGKGYIVYDDVDGLDIDDLKARCPALPESIENYKKQSNNQEIAIIQDLPPEEIREIRSALNYIDPDDRDTWIRVGMALKSTGSPAAEGLFNEYSQRSDKYNPADQPKRWKTLKPKGDLTIASIFHEAQKAGWVTTYERKEVATVLPPITDIDKVRQSFERELFPKDLLKPAGLVGDIMKYIIENSIKRQPIFALAAALTAVGVLAGRKVQTGMRVRTNIYALCVGESGCGKEAPRKIIKELFLAAGCGELANVEELASDTSIVTTLKKSPAQIFLLDEIGRFLKTTLSATHGSHLYNIVTTLLKLYSEKDQIFNGKNYADGDKKVTIAQPHLCLLGTTVPDTLYRGLTLEHVTNGFLARMLIFETDDSYPPKTPRRDMTSKPPVEILDQIRALYRKPVNLVPDGNLDHLNPCPQIVPLTLPASDILKEFDCFIEDMRKELRAQGKVETTYNRTTEMAEQIALILATGRNIDNPEIDEDDMTFAIRLSKYLSDHMFYIVHNYIANNEQEHEVKRVLKLIRDAGKLKFADIARKTQNLRSYERDDIICILLNSEQIIEYSTGSGGAKTTWYMAKEDEIEKI